LGFGKDNVKDPNDFFRVFYIKIKDNDDDGVKFEGFYDDVDFGLLFYNFFTKQFQLFIYSPIRDNKRDTEIRRSKLYFMIFARELITYLCGLRLAINYYESATVNYYNYVPDGWRHELQSHFIFDEKKRLYMVKHNPEEENFKKFEIGNKGESTDGIKSDKETQTIVIGKDRPKNVDFDIRFTLSKVDDEVSKRDYQPITEIPFKEMLNADSIKLKSAMEKAIAAKDVEDKKAAEKDAIRKAKFRAEMDARIAARKAEESAKPFDAAAAAAAEYDNDPHSPHNR